MARFECHAHTMYSNLRMLDSICQPRALIDYAQEIDPEEVKEKITKKAKEIEQEVKDLNGEKVARIAKEKAKMIENKCNDLVDLAISVSEPAIETMAEELRKKTIKSLKEITKKLENND